MAEETQPCCADQGRRHVLGAGVLGVAAIAVAGCSSGSGDSGNSSSSSSSGSLAKTSDIPEGGGKIFASEKVVVTQPSSGTYKAFSAVCPHQGCTVSSISGDAIVCPCHGSKFKISDGSLISGPAKTGLTTKQVTVSGTEIKLA